MKRFVSGARERAKNFRKEFKKQALTAISAAFAFLVALSWKEPITGLVNQIVERAGLSEKIVFYQFLSAFFVTLIAVIAIVLVAKWSVEKENLPAK